MSGISGWVDYAHNLEDEHKQMAELSETLRPRGPEAGSEWKSPECFFVHRNSRINNEQLLIKGQGITKYILTLDGELYNAPELKKKLEKLGYSLTTGSDAELILSSYMAWGEECMKELNGIFAFAVWNDTHKKLFLARDRVGVKPLFFYRYDGGIIFGSEIKTVLAHRKVPHEIDEKGVASITLLGPARKLGDGIFKNIYEVKPGHFAVVTKSDFNLNKYWEIKAKPHTESLEETSEHVRELIIDSIERQLTGDRPLCTFLSGGLDSSIITVIAANKLREQNKQLITYSVDYKDNNLNFKASAFQPDEDAPWITEMTNFVNSIRRNVIIDTPQLYDALEAAVEARDLPGMADVDSSLYLFLKEVKKEFSVGLSGECADEIFGGYPWYHNEEMLYAEGFPWSRSTNERAALLKKGVIGSINPTEYINSFCHSTAREADFLGSDSPKDRRIREMFMMNFDWFMQTLVDRNDRMASACAMDTRVPFCDYRVVEYVYNIPWEMRAWHGREKGLLRHAFQDMLPGGVAWRKKSPFPKTYNPTYFNAVINRTDEILSSEDCRITEIFEADMLKKLIETSGKSFEKNWYGQLMQSPQLFAYLIQLEHWLKHYEVKINN